MIWDTKERNSGVFSWVRVNQRVAFENEMVVLTIINIIFDWYSRKEILGGVHPSILLL